PTLRQTTTKTDQRAVRPPRQKRWLLLAVLLTVMVLAGGAAVLVSRPARSPDVAPEKERPKVSATPAEGERAIHPTLQGGYVADTNEIRCLAYSGDGRFLVTGSFDHTAVIWDTATMQPRVRLGGHRGVVEAVAFSPDSKRLVTASADGVLRLWTVPEGTG